MIDTAGHFLARESRGQRWIRWSVAWLLVSAVLGCVPQPIPSTQPPRVEVVRERIAVSPSPLEFGEVDLGRVAEADFIVRNEGNGNARLSRVKLEGEGFRVVRDDCSNRVLRAGDACAVTVAFQPHRDGRYSAVAEVLFPELSENRFRLGLSGEGRGRRRPDIRVAPASLEFGPLESGEDRVLNVEVRNDGRADLRMEGVSVEGGAFDLSSDGCSRRVVSPGRTCSLEVRFAPDRKGEYSGRLTLDSNDPDQRTVTVGLRGRGDQAAKPDIAMVPNRLDFGRVEAGRARELDLEVRNQGRGELVVKRAAVEGAGFDVTSDGCSGRSVPQGRSCGLKIRFSPPAGGDYEGLVFLASNDPDERRTAVPLRGTGEKRGRPNIEVRPVGVDFGTVEAGSARTLDVEVANSGRDDLKVQEVIAEGAAFGIASDGCSGRTVPPGRSCVVGVRFLADRAGEYRGNLNVASNDPDRRRVAVAMRGMGEKRGRPEISLVPSRLDFGRLDLGKSRSQEVVVRNDGKADLKVKRIKLEAKAFTLQADGCSDRVVPPQRSCGITVGFAPDGVGEFAGALTVVSNDEDEKRSTVSLVGMGEQRKRPPEQRPCRSQRVDMKEGRDQLQALVEGDLGDDSCITLELTAEEKGRLLVCVPEGYGAKGAGLEPDPRESCEGAGKGRYQAFQSKKLKKDSDVSVTVSRGAGTPGRYRIYLEMDKKSDAKPRPPFGPPFGPGKGRRGDD